MVRYIVRTERKGSDATAGLPFYEAAAQICLDTCGSLITILGCL
jgi:hypothetical protein